MTTSVQQPASGKAPWISAAVVGTVAGAGFGLANDLGVTRSAGAGLVAGAAIGALGYAGTKLLPKAGLDPDLSKRMMVGAGITGAAMGTAHLLGFLQMSNVNSVAGSAAFVLGAGIAGAMLGAGYSAIRDQF